MSRTNAKQCEGCGRVYPLEEFETGRQTPSRYCHGCRTLRFWGQRPTPERLDKGLALLGYTRDLYPDADAGMIAAVLRDSEARWTATFHRKNDVITAQSRKFARSKRTVRHLEARCARLVARERELFARVAELEAREADMAARETRLRESIDNIAGHDVTPVGDPCFTVLQHERY